MRVIELSDNPVLVGSKLGEKVQIELSNRDKITIMLIKVNRYGIEGKNTSLLDCPLQFFPWSNIIKVSAKNEEK